MHRLVLLFAAGLALAQPAAVLAQAAPPPCSAPEASQLDFWVGSWDLRWTTAKGDVQHGRNVVKKVLGGCVVQENFDGGDSLPLRGVSHSVYDRQSGQWKQTWVDNMGGYLDFTGGFADGKMMLSREFTGPKGQRLHQRMVFENIEREKFDWNWQLSQDGGTTWKDMWKIKYTRAAASQTTPDNIP